MPFGIPGGFFRFESRLVLGCDYVHTAAFAVEFHFPIDECEECVVPALPDTFARVELGAKLPHDDIAGDDLLAAVTLHAAALTVGIATVATGALTFFMCHGFTLEAERRADESRFALERLASFVACLSYR
jgi:hypothetical protein